MATLLVLSTAPNLKTAKALAESLVERRLAACVSLVPGVLSHYQWKGKRESAREILLMIKTRSERYQALEKWFKKNHPYTVPEILTFKVSGGNSDYLRWVHQETRKGRN